jgi:spore coat protein A, manganese oxidase
MDFTGPQVWRGLVGFHIVRDGEEDALPGMPDGPSDMEEFEALEETEAVTTRRFRFTQSAGGGETIWTINGEPFDPERIDARPELGSAEVWEFVTDVHRPVHLHLVPLKVLSRQGQRTLRKDASWKDTVVVPPGNVVRVLARFDGFRGRYVFHCHNLEHEDMMMANFEVV